MMRLATYKEVQQWVKTNYGFVPKTCWIAHCKDILGLEPRKAPNRQSSVRTNPCPPEKKDAIVKAFKHYDMI